MAEVKTRLTRSQDDDGETVLTIEANHTWSDVLREVAADIGWGEVEFLVSRLKDDPIPDGGK